MSAGSRLRRVPPLLLPIVFCCGVLLAVPAAAAEPDRPADPAAAPTAPAAPSAPVAPAPAKPADPKKPGPTGGDKPADIVITGSRVPTEQKHEGASVAVVDGAELGLHRPSTVWEALRFTPGTAFAQTGTTGQTTSLFLRGGESDHTLVLLDGFKVNNDGGDFPWETLVPGGAGRIEVLRGAGSALYGADAMTGAVQVLTERGAGPPRLSLTAEGGNLGQSRETARLVGEDGPFAYNLSLSRYNLTDGRMPNSDTDITAFSGRLDWETAGGLHVELVQHTAGQEVGNYESDDIQDPNALVRHRRELTGLIFEGQIAGVVDSRLSIGRGRSHYFYEDGLDAVDTVYYRTARDLERLSADWQNSAQIYEIGPAVGRLTAGVAWEEELGQVDALASGGADSANHIDRVRTARAFYLEKRLELWEALTLDAGMRTEEHSTYGTTTSARTAGALWLEWTKGFGTKLHASWGRSIKSPTFFENFDDSYYDL
ncbi:MAG TPA: TonB-dependent receptor, partial [Planctomycetota bacterium]|nr:TonB-dependent receptor [Planctomycetota bacterium]